MGNPTDPRRDLHKEIQESIAQFDALQTDRVPRVDRRMVAFQDAQSEIRNHMRETEVAMIILSGFIQDGASVGCFTIGATEVAKECKRTISAAEKLYLAALELENIN
jgi:hypothetical protein